MFPPNIIGSPDSPDPITITLLLFDSESLIVASIPLSFRILVVNDEFKILFASDENQVFKNSRFSFFFLVKCNYHLKNVGGQKYQL